MLFSTTLAHAYSIRGKIVDGENNKPLRMAIIIAYNDSSKVVAGLNSDQNGIFVTANISEQQILVEVQREGYETTYMKVSGSPEEQLDLGVIELKPKAANKPEVELQEVEVVAQSVIQKPDRYIVIPSKDEIDRAANSLSLLSSLRMKLPGLKVIEELQSVTIENRTPVFKINGKSADMNKVMSINNENILRIEYFDNPDIRYNNYVINFITKPRRDGGSIVTNWFSAFTTGNLNGNVGFTYYNKKSEWNLNYGLNWRNYDDRRVSSEDSFIGGTQPIRRLTDGLPEEFGYTTNVLSLEYTYMHNPNTMFSIKIGGRINDQHSDDASLNRLLIGDDESSYKSLTKRNVNIKSPDLDLFFRKQFNNGHSIEANAYATYNTGNYDREYSDIYLDPTQNYNISSVTDNDSWGAGGEIMYSKQFKHFTTNFGIRDRYTHAESTNVENGETSLSDQNSNNLYAYASIVGRIQKLGYTIGVGGMHIHASDGNDELNAMRVKANVNLNYAISKHLSLNYLFMYDPSAPALSQQSENMYRVDEIVVRQGNMSLEPQEWFRNRIYARYSIGKFISSLWLSHSRTTDPIYYDYSYINNPGSQFDGMFLQRPINGLRDDRLAVEFYIGGNGLFNHLSVEGKLGWDGYTIRKNDNEKYTDRRFYASIYSSLYFGPWTFMANYELKPQYNLSGNTLSRNERWNTISVQYRWRDLRVGLYCTNLFTKRGATYHSKTLSNVHPEVTRSEIRDNANMISLSLNYRLNFGKGFNKARRTLKNEGADSGVNIEY